MNSTNDKLRQLDNPSLTPDKRALLRCRFAAELIHTGQYGAAREALGDFWQGIGKRPDVRGLASMTAAEVLLQCGVLSGWLGGVKSVKDAQERAKDLLTEAQRKFESQGQSVKVSEVKYELGMCYWRLGSYDEARIVLEQGLDGLEDNQLKAKILIRRTLVDVWTGRLHDALKILEQAQTFFESCNDALKGRWHGQQAIVLMYLSTSERRTDYADRAIMEFTAAAYHFEQAHHESYCAVALNNLAILLCQFGRYEEAHENLDRAIRVSERLKDEGLIAQMNESRSRVLVAEQRYQEANKIISGVIHTFEKGGEFALLADAFTTQGVVWARLRLYESSVHILRRAMHIAYDSGALSNAGLAALTMIEEHGAERLVESDLLNIYRRADEWLKDTQDAEHIARLRACARVVFGRVSALISKPRDENFSLYEAMHAYEARMIEDALEAESGIVTRAAKRLGVSHQSLIQILNTRHRNLMHKRTPPTPRGKKPE